MVAIQFNELRGDERVREFLRQQFRVGVADAKTDHGAGVAKNGLPDFRGKLVKVLVGQRQAQPILARLSQDRRKAVGREVVELVNEQVEIATPGLRQVGARHGRELKLGREQRTQQIRLVGPEFAFGQVGDEHAAGVHQEAKINLGFDLAKNVPDRRVHQELADFVLNRCDGFADEARIVAGEFLRPEFAHERVINLAHDPRAIFRVGEHPVHPEQGSILAIEQGEEGVVEDVFHARPPRIAPDALEGGDDAGSDQVPLVRRDVGEEVQADGEFEITGIEIDEVVRARGREVIEQFVGEVAVRIEQREAMPEVKVLQNHVPQEGRFT